MSRPITDADRSVQSHRFVARLAVAAAARSTIATWLGLSRQCWQMTPVIDVDPITCRRVAGQTGNVIVSCRLVTDSVKNRPQVRHDNRGLDCACAETMRRSLIEILCLQDTIPFCSALAKSRWQGCVKTKPLAFCRQVRKRLARKVRRKLFYLVDFRRTWACAAVSVKPTYVELDGKQICSVCKTYLFIVFYVTYVV